MNSSVLGRVPAGDEAAWSWRSGSAASSGRIDDRLVLHGRGGSNSRSAARLADSLASAASIYIGDRRSGDVWPRLAFLVKRSMWPGGKNWLPHWRRRYRSRLREIHLLGNATRPTTRDCPKSCWRLLSAAVHSEVFSVGVCLWSTGGQRNRCLRYLASSAPRPRHGRIV